jgi:hypothetical protein
MLSFFIKMKEEVLAKEERKVKREREMGAREKGWEKRRERRKERKKKRWDGG